MPDSQVTIVGNVTREPEIKYVSGGQATCRIGVAVNRRWEANGEKKEATSYFDVVCWRDLAENVAESIGKGTRVVVTGRLEQRSWEQDGQKRYAVEIIADEVAPSLRWATCRVEKVERSSNGAATTSSSI